jgi:hypothetical protein
LVAGCGGKGEEASSSTPTPLPTPDVIETFTPPSPAPEKDSIPAEPHISAADLDALISGAVSYVEVANNHEAEAEGKVELVIQNPNNQNADLIKLYADPGVVPEIARFEVDRKGEPLDVPGTVVKLGSREIKEGEIDAGTPDISIVVFDGKVTPGQFVAADSIYWDWFGNETTPTAKIPWLNGFQDRFLPSKSQPNQYYGVTWGEAETVGLVINRGVNVGDVIRDRNGAREIDPSKFNIPSSDYSDGVWPTGTIAIEGSVGDKTAFFVVQNANRENYATVQLPNTNSENVHKLIDDYVRGIKLSTARADVDDRYAAITTVDSMS